MNFLAHFHLAWPEDGLLAGALEGDYYKGPLQPDLSPAIARGVALHRAIDAYTDDHPLIVQLRREFPPGLRRYAGILIDLCFDHYLSRHWQQFCEVDQGQFNQVVYRSLQQQDGMLSENSRQMLARLVQYDILGLYRDWETVPASAARIGERFKRHNPFLDIDHQLAPLQGRLQDTFLAFYPDLQAFSTERRRRLNYIDNAPSNIAL